MNPLEQFDDQEQLSSVRSKINNNFTELENRSIGDLSDVDVTTTTPTTDDILTWDGSSWTPTSQGGGSIPQMYLNDISDVDIASTLPSDGQTIVWDAAIQTWVPGDVSSGFVDLTDTPGSLDAGSYLRVNATGDAIEQIRTAPPDGGVGDNSDIQALTTFPGKLPDIILMKQGTAIYPYVFTKASSTTIQYTYWSDYDTSKCWYVNFDGAGENMVKAGQTASGGWNPEGYTKIQQFIDNGQAVFHGQKSGSSGVGRLSYWKQTYGTPKGSNNVSWKFMHDLPDAIVTKDGDGSGGYWDSPFTISEIGYNDNVANPTSIDVYYRNQSIASYYIIFNLNTVDGDYRTSSKVDLTELTGSTPSLADYIEGGRALYYGAPHGDSVKTGTYISDGTTSQQINLGFRPKMVTIKGVHTTDSAASYAGTNYFYDETVFDTIIESGDYIPRRYRNTDSRLVGHVDTTNEQAGIEINDTGFKIVGNSKTNATAGNNSVINMLGAKYHYFAIGPDVSVSGDGASYTDSDVSTYLNGNLDTHIIPDTNATYDIGSAEKKIRHFYLSDNSLKFVGADDVEHPLSVSDGQLKFDDKPVPHKFTDLPDVPTSLDSGSYLRVNAAGDAIEQIKTAPPDGGVGDNSEVKMYSNFAGKLPDSIIAKTSTGQIVMGRFYHINSSDETGDIHYAFNEFGGNQYMAFFKNDSLGTNARFSSIASSWQFFDGALTLQAVIDSGNAIYHGQKSGTSGAGSLSYLKSLVNSSANGGFYTELPDAIVSEYSSDSNNGVFKLHQVEPNTTAGGTAWEVVYRMESFSSGDYYMGYLLDADGTLVEHAMVTHTNPTTRNLRWYIQNGRALYLGGQQDFGVKAWGTFDGTQGSGDNYNITGFTGGNVASIVRIDTAIYKVTFINPAPHANYSVSGSCNPSGTGGSFFGVNNDVYPVTATDFHIELRDNSNGWRNNDRISFQVVY